MRYGVPLTLLAAVLLVSGCSDDARPVPTVAEAAATPAPAYDETLQPSAAVLSLVPEAARTLTVTDYRQVRDELGLTPVATTAEQPAFWARAESERPMLTTGLLRPAADRLAPYGFGQADVEWEAHFLGADDAELGWVLELRASADLAQVQRAVTDGVGPLGGATVDADRRLVTRGTVVDPEQSWAADPATRGLVGLSANATYVSRDCVPSDTAVPGLDALEGPYSVQFEGTLVTARLGEDRHDLFARMRLALADPGFVRAFEGGVADPLTGRIGYVMSDPADAASLALRRALPFAVCS